MKGIIILIASIIISVNSFAQDTLNFKTVDTVTYNAYLQKDWNKVIAVGSSALEQNIDYYFLRMRIGIAYFEKQNYRKSIIHFEKAMDANNVEVIATEYLYYAYKNIGDDIQALKTLSKSNTKYANLLLNRQKIFQNIYSFTSIRIYSTNKFNEKDQLAFHAETERRQKPIYTQQFIPESYINFQLGATIRLSPGWRINLSYQNFQVKGQQYMQDPMQESKEETQTSQTQWNLNNTIRFSNKLKASIFLTYLSTKASYTSINTEQFPIVYSNIRNESSSNFLLGIGLSRSQSYFDLFWKASFLTHFNNPVLQSDLGIKIYPLGNQKIMTQTSISFLKADTTSANFIFSQSISYSPHERINFTLSGNWGQMSMWNTENGYSVYNGIYKLSELYQAKVTVRIVKQLYFKAYCEFMKNSSNTWSKSLLPFDSGESAVVINQNKFNTYSIIGGLIWEF